MTAPMIQRSGKKIPKKNIQPCPFLNVMNPRVNSKTTYRKTPVPIPHHMGLLSRSSCFQILLAACRDSDSGIAVHVSLVAEGAAKLPELVHRRGPEQRVRF
jgi:hypothetical protein